MAATDGTVGTPSSVPIPDPTTLTTEQLKKAVAAEHEITAGLLDVLRERLDGMDAATDLRLKVVDHIPERIDEKVQHLADLHDERFTSIATQFRERDTRSERESRDNKVAVDAAFAAQKEAASEQNKSNTLAIQKSETATAETITKLQDLFATSIKSLEDKIEDDKTRIGRVESRVDLSSGRASGVDASRAILLAVVPIVITIIIAAVTLVVTLHG